MKDGLFESLFEGTESDPLGQAAELPVTAPPRSVSKGHGVYSLPWLARVLPEIRTPTQLVVALLIYRECLLRRCNTVALSNGELRKLGVSRYAKYRALARLREAGVIAIEESNTRRSVRPTLLWFP
jgi:hypothetical protein